MACMYMNVQDGRTESRRSRRKSRPRTIHIDVYCSTSSSEEEDSLAHASSDDSLHRPTAAPPPPRALVALGSKNNPKNQVDLKRRRSSKEAIPMLDQSPSSHLKDFTDSSKSQPPTFMTDVPPPPTDSPHEPHSTTTTSATRETSVASSSNATQILSPCKDQLSSFSGVSKNIQQPVRPTTLPLSFVASPRGLDRQKDSSLSYANSPLDLSAWEQDPDMPSSALSWRGSDFDATISQQASDFESESNIREISVSRSEVFYEGDSEGTEVESNTSSVAKYWRSPQLERRKYIQKGQEDRYREAVKRRTNKSSDESKDSSLDVLPPTSDVEALSKLTVFQNFSAEELEVISKSLNKKESLASVSKKVPSFRTIEREESLKLIKRMVASHEPSKDGSSKSNSFNLYHDMLNGDFKSNLKRSASLESKSSSACSRATSLSIGSKKLDTIGDESLEMSERKVSHSSIASPLSKSLLGIPGELDEVSLLPEQTLSSSTSALELSEPSDYSNINTTTASTTTPDGRLVNVGVYRNLSNRFPFHESSPSSVSPPTATVEISSQWC